MLVHIEASPWTLEASPVSFKMEHVKNAHHTQWTTGDDDKFSMQSLSALGGSILARFSLLTGSGHLLHLVKGQLLRRAHGMIARYRQVTWQHESSC